MIDPTLLRRAIESVGIEKPSDYTLVMEEVERLMDKQIVERTAKAIDPFAWANVHGMDHRRDVSLRHARLALSESGLWGLIRAATDLVQEMEEMGYGKTSDRALPGSYDNLLAALKEVRG